MAAEFPSVPLLFALLLFSLFLKGGASRSLSKEQVDNDLEIERKLNKLPIKTIYTEWGDILDCVDINKQPAFDHPLLKDHKIRMKPSFPLENDAKLSRDELSSIFMLPDEECPEGTVPILRTHKESSIKDVSQTRPDGDSLAGVKYDVSGETYYGAAALLDVYNPKLTGNDTFSSAEIAVENGPDGIRVGWTVNPNLNGDNYTRIFALFTTDSYQKTGCYNLECPGFFQVDKRVPLGNRITNTSVLGGVQAMVEFWVYQDKKTGDWWLVLQKKINVGYWPKNIFESLNGGCNQIYWGGHVKKSSSGHSPEMGSGRAPDLANYGWACDFEHMQYLDGTSTWINPKGNHVKDVLECSGGNCKGRYGVNYFGFQKQGDFGHTFLFGGPGGGPDDS